MMRLTTFLVALIPLVVSSIRAATTCNGDPSLCNKLYSNVTYIGAHDSYAVGSSVADNQDKDVTAQLNDGVRALQVQTHNASDGIHLCHTSCTLLDGGTLESYLSNVAAWIASNPNDVVTLVMVNIDDLPPTSFTSAFTSAGLNNHTYSPPSGAIPLTSWPTLGTLIDAGTTLVVFMDEEADFSSVPFIIDEFSNMWEDAYDATTPSWACATNRSTGNPGSTMMLVNHFLDSTFSIAGNELFVPDKTDINTTNSNSSIGQHVTNCQSIWGRNPNIILMDFYDSNGNSPFDYVASLNAIAAPTNTVTAGGTGEDVASTATGSAAGSTATGSASSSSQTAAVSTSHLSGAERVTFARPGVWLGALGTVTGLVVGGITAL